MATIHVTVDDQAARQTLSRLASVGTDRKTMKRVALAAKQEVYETFRHAADPWGNPWPPLAPSTLRARSRRGNQSTQPLIDTNKLYPSIKATATDSEAIVKAGEGLPDARAWYNQFGTKWIKPRAFFPIRTTGAVVATQDWLDRVKAPINDAIAKAAA